jgi:hypothetical protein
LMVRLETPRLPKATAAQVLPRALSKTCQSRRCRAARSLQRQHRPASCRVRSGRRRRAGAVICCLLPNEIVGATGPLSCVAVTLRSSRNFDHQKSQPANFDRLMELGMLEKTPFVPVPRDKQRATNALVAQNPFMVIMGVYRGFRIRTTWTCSPLHISPASLWCCPPHSVTIGLTSTHLSLAWSTAVRLA